MTRTAAQTRGHGPVSGVVQRGATAGDWATADPPRRPPLERSGGVVPRLPLSGGQLDVPTPSGGQGEWHKGELFPRVGFVVTNLRRSAVRVVRFYNQRGTAEQWIKEGKNAVNWTRLSCHGFVDNHVRLQLRSRERSSKPSWKGLNG